VLDDHLFIIANIAKIANIANIEIQRVVRTVIRVPRFRAARMTAAAPSAYRTDVSDVPTWPEVE